MLPRHKVALAADCALSAVTLLTLYLTKSFDGLSKEQQALVISGVLFGSTLLTFGSAYIHHRFFASHSRSASQQHLINARHSPREPVSPVIPSAIIGITASAAPPTEYHAGIGNFLKPQSYSPGRRNS